MGCCIWSGEKGWKIWLNLQDKTWFGYRVEHSSVFAGGSTKSRRGASIYSDTLHILFSCNHSSSAGWTWDLSFHRMIIWDWERLSNQEYGFQNPCSPHSVRNSKDPCPRRPVTGQLGPPSVSWSILGQVPPALRAKASSSDTHSTLGRVKWELPIWKLFVNYNTPHKHKERWLL